MSRDGQERQGYDELFFPVKMVNAFPVTDALYEELLQQKNASAQPGKKDWKARFVSQNGQLYFPVKIRLGPKVSRKDRQLWDYQWCRYIKHANVRAFLENIHRAESLQFYTLGSPYNLWKSLITSKHIIGIRLADVGLYLSGSEVHQGIQKAVRIHDTVSPILPHGGHRYFEMDCAWISWYDDLGRRKMLTMIDVFTKKAWAWGLDDMTAYSMVQKATPVIENEIRILKKLREGGEDVSTLVIHTDNGKEFMEIFENGMVGLGDEEIRVEVRHGLHHHPWVQGCVERFNKTIKTLLHIHGMLHQDVGDWGAYLQKAVDNYNNAVHSAISMTPEQLHSMTMDSRSVGSLIYDARSAINSKKLAKAWAGKTLKVGDIVRVAKNPLPSKYSKDVVDWESGYWVIDKVSVSLASGRENISPHGPIYTLRSLNMDRETGKLERGNGMVVKWANQVKRVQFYGGQKTIEVGVSVRGERYTSFLQDDDGQFNLRRARGLELGNGDREFVLDNPPEELSGDPRGEEIVIENSEAEEHVIEEAGPAPAAPASEEPNDAPIDTDMFGNIVLRDNIEDYAVIGSPVAPRVRSPLTPPSYSADLRQEILDKVKRKRKPEMGEINELYRRCTPEEGVTISIDPAYIAAAQPGRMLFTGQVQQLLVYNLLYKQVPDPKYTPMTCIVEHTDFRDFVMRVVNGVTQHPNHAYPLKFSVIVHTDSRGAEKGTVKDHFFIARVRKEPGAGALRVDFFDSIDDPDRITAKVMEEVMHHFHPDPSMFTISYSTERNYHHLDHQRNNHDEFISSCGIFAVRYSLDLMYFEEPRTGADAPTPDWVGAQRDLVLRISEIVGSAFEHKEDTDYIIMYTDNGEDPYYQLRMRYLVGTCGARKKKFMDLVH